MARTVATLPGDSRQLVPPDRSLPIQVDLQPNHVEGIDAWIAEQPDPKPSRPEVIRRILDEWLNKRGHLPQA